MDEVHCTLCGFPTNGGPYCHAHTWAGGPDIQHEQEFQNPSTEHIRITHLHDYWMQRYTPEEVAELGAYLEEAV